MLAELYHLLVRKGGATPADANTKLRRWRDFATIVSTDEQAFAEAMDLALLHQFQIYDAMILASAAAAGGGLLLSEDMQDGFVWRGVTVRNPFDLATVRFLERALG